MPGRVRASCHRDRRYPVGRRRVSGAPPLPARRRRTGRHPPACGAGVGARGRLSRLSSASGRPRGVTAAGAAGPRSGGVALADSDHGDDCGWSWDRCESAEGVDHLRGRRTHHRQPSKQAPASVAFPPEAGKGMGRSSLAGCRRGLRFGSLVADQQSVEVLVSLQYSNGRIYETSYVSSVELRPGSEFDLHGRHWRVVGVAKQQRWVGPNPPPRTLCVSTGARSSPTP